MKNYRVVRIFILILLLVLGIVSFTKDDALMAEFAEANSTIQDIGVLVEQADLIIIGQATHVISYASMNKYGDEIFVNDVHFEVEETLKGETEPKQSIDITGLAGDSVDGSTMVSSETPLFILNGRSVLFLEKDTININIMGGYYGKFDIDGANQIPRLGWTLEHLRMEILVYSTDTHFYLPSLVNSADLLNFAYQGDNGWWDSGGHNSYAAPNPSGRMVAGDFNGDGQVDIATLYDYPIQRARLHVWLSTGSSFDYQGDNGWWDSGGHNSYAAPNPSGRMVAGDFNGDGLDDIVTLYDYPIQRARLHVWLSSQ